MFDGFLISIDHNSIVSISTAKGDVTVIGKRIEKNDGDSGISYISMEGHVTQQEDMGMREIR